MWLPSVGELATVSFAGQRAEELGEAFRYNLATDSAAVAIPLEKGDSYTIDADVEVLTGRDLEALVGTPVSNVELPEAAHVEIVSQFATEISAGEDGLARAQQIADHLRAEGYLSHGEEDGVLAGHGARRITDFLSADYQVGDGEQFASTLALALRGQGIPSRVVMGFKPEGASEVTGEHLDAWVEVPLDREGWVPLDATPDDRDVPEEPPEPPTGGDDPAPPPARPPVTQPPEEVPSSAEECDETQDTTDAGSDTDPASPTSTSQPPADEQSADSVESSDDEDCVDPPLPPTDQGLPWWVAAVAASTLGPFAVVGGSLGSIAWAKQRRRSRRQTRGPASTRIASGWADISDLAIDLGSPIPPRTTRREAAQFLGDDAAAVLASTDRRGGLVRRGALRRGCRSVLGAGRSSTFRDAAGSRNDWAAESAGQSLVVLAWQRSSE